MDVYNKEDEDEAELSEKEKKTRATNIRNTMGIMGKLHNIVVHIRASANRTQHFIKLAGKRIPLDNHTRWNSWFYMLERALCPEIQSALNQYVQEWSQVTQGGIDKRDILSIDDWIQLRTISDFLSYFEGATKFMQGKEATLE